MARSLQSWLPALFVIVMAITTHTVRAAEEAEEHKPPKSASKATCYVVKEYWPFAECKAEDSAQVCSRGWGAWQSQELCCTPGVAFPEGCKKRPSECWVVESQAMKTCIRDDRKCLQGSGVWGSQAACCAPNGAFPEGCASDVKVSEEPCFVVDTYFPARLCRASNTLCSPESGTQFYKTKEACCGSNGAFGQSGCSAAAPQTPCFVVDSYWPERKCRKEADVAICSRGWGVYTSENVCCAPAVAFPQGCSVTSEAGAAALPPRAPAATAAAGVARQKPPAIPKAPIPAFINGGDAATVMAASTQRVGLENP